MLVERKLNIRHEYTRILPREAASTNTSCKIIRRIVLRPRMSNSCSLTADEPIAPRHLARQDFVQPVAMALHPTLVEKGDIQSAKNSPLLLKSALTTKLRFHSTHRIKIKHEKYDLVQSKRHREFGAQNISDSPNFIYITAFIKKPKG